MVDLFRKTSAQVPLLTVDSDVPDPKVRRAYIGTNNYLAGRAAGELVKKAIPGGGKVVIFVGKMDAAQRRPSRRQGVLDVLAGIDSQEIKDRTPPGARDVALGKYTLVDTRTDGVDQKVCQTQAEDIFTKYPDIDAVVGLWAYNPPAMLRAKAKMKAKAAVIGFDENDDTLNAIRDGSCVGTIVQNPYEFGYQSVKILAAARQGRRRHPEDLSRHRRREPHLHPAPRHREGQRRRVPGGVQQAAREVTVTACPFSKLAASARRFRA